MLVVVTEKTLSGELRVVDEREWKDSMIAMLHHANYLLLGGKEYEMVEGRLNVNDEKMEVLVLAVKSEAAKAAESESADAAESESADATERKE